jgi:hypothetical protein
LVSVEVRARSGARTPFSENAMTSAVIPETPVKGSDHAEPKILFLDLKAQFAGIRDEVMAAISGVMESQSFIMGPDVKLLEDELAAMLGAKHAFASSALCARYEVSLETSWHEPILSKF